MNGDTTVETTETFTVNLVEPVERDDRRDRQSAPGRSPTTTPCRRCRSANVDRQTRATPARRTSRSRSRCRPRAPSTVTVDYATADGSARRARRLRRGVGDADLQPRQTAKQIVVAVNGDTTVETTETFTVNLINPSNATIAGTGIGTGTITNDDALPTLTIGNATVDRGQLGHDERRLRGHAVGAEREHGHRRLRDRGRHRRPPPATTRPRRARSPSRPARPQSRSSSRSTATRPSRRTRPSRSTCRTRRTRPSPGRASAPGRSPNDDSLPTVTIGDATANEGNSGTTNFTFTVTLVGAERQHGHGRLRDRGRLGRRAGRLRRRVGERSPSAPGRRQADRRLRQR